MPNVNPIPAGYHTVTPFLIVKGAAQAIDFYKKAFGATQIFRMDAPGGKVAHAELQIGNSRIMVSDEHPEMGYLAPRPGEKAPIGLHIYVEDVDKVAAQALAAGIQTERPVADQFYGDRTGTFIDPFGVRWSIATHKEDVSEEELARRMSEAMRKSA